MKNNLLISTIFMNFGSLLLFSAAALTSEFGNSSKLPALPQRSTPGAPGLFKSCLNGGLNPSAEEPESTAKKLFSEAELGSAEALTRLILSEGLSSGFLEKGKCGPSIQTQDIFNAIGDGIRLRQLKAKKTLEAEVFGRKQYSTSFIVKYSKSNPKLNPFAQIFLCPEKTSNYISELRNNKGIKEGAENLSAEQVYKMAQIAATQSLQKKSVLDFGTDFQKVTNFYYPKSSIYGHITPIWAKTYTQTKNVSAGCVLFYRP